MTGKKPKELDYKEPDPSICYLVNHFYSIKKQKGIKISYTEIAAYNDLMCCDFEAWEIETIMNIDNDFERT